MKLTDISYARAVMEKHGISPQKRFGQNFLINPIVPQRIAEECGANHSVGTNMTILAPVIAEKYDLTYTKTNDLDEAIAHLRDGGAIIAHVGIPKGATIGLFTKSGHYISLISTDGKEFCILDPSYSTEKYKIPERIGRVNESNAPYLYADINTLHSETKPGRTKYHLFARKKELWLHTMNLVRKVKKNPYAF